MNPRITTGSQSLPDILVLLFKICVFKAKPQDLPASISLVVILALASIATNLAIDSLGMSVFDSIMLSLAHVIGFGLAVWVLLKFRNRTSRWLQTTAAVYGTTTLVRVISWPITSWVLTSLQSEGAVSSWFFLGAFAFLALGIWSLSIIMVIFREAMEISKLASFLITVAIVLAIPLAIIELYELALAPQPSFSE